MAEKDAIELVNVTNALEGGRGAPGQRAGGVLQPPNLRWVLYEQEEVQKRDRWANTPTFIIASLGAAIGLGNFWRFPAQVYNYGGAIFFIPYFVCLFVMGIPLAQLELCMGQRMQRGDVHSFSKVNARLRGVGVASVFGSIFVAAYYVVIIGWTLTFLVESFYPDPPWRTDADEWDRVVPDLPGDIWNSSVMVTPSNFANASFAVYKANTALNNTDGILVAPSYACRTMKFDNSTTFGWLTAFTRNITTETTFAEFSSMAGYTGPNLANVTNETIANAWFNVSNGNYFLNKAVSAQWNERCISHDALSWDIFIVWKTYLAVVVCWIIVVACIMYGVSSSSYAVWVTMPLPITTLIILFFVAITREGAGLGIEAYVGVWDFSRLFDVDIWSAAAGQIFFSIGVCFGILTSYGSYMPRDAPIVKSVFAICLCNSIFSFISGFAVFGMLGYLATSQGVPLQDVAAGGPALVFDVYPDALMSLGQPWGNLMCIVLFVTLFALGIDSAFAFSEAVITVICDLPMGGTTLKEYLQGIMGRKVAGPVITLIICSLLCAAGALFCLNIGYAWLDTGDHFMGQYLVQIDGVLECIAVGWVWAYQQDCQEFGSTSALALQISYYLGLAVWVVVASILGGWGIVIGFAVFLLIFVVGFGISYVSARPPSGTMNVTFLHFLRVVIFSGPNYITEHVAWVDRDRDTDVPWGVGVDGSGNWFVHTLGYLWHVYWTVVIKWLLPAVLIVLISLMVKQDLTAPYGNYPVALIVTCFVGAVVALLFCAALVFFPAEAEEDEAATARLRMVDVSRVKTA